MSNTVFAVRLMCWWLGLALIGAAFWFFGWWGLVSLPLLWPWWRNWFAIASEVAK